MCRDVVRCSDDWRLGIGQGPKRQASEEEDVYVKGGWMAYSFLNMLAVFA